MGNPLANRLLETPLAPAPIVKPRIAPSPSPSPTRRPEPRPGTRPWKIPVIRPGEETRPKGELEDEEGLLEPDEDEGLPNDHLNLPPRPNSHRLLRRPERISPASLINQIAHECQMEDFDSPTRDIQGKRAGEKDLQRMRDLEKRANGDGAKMIRLAQIMARAIRPGSEKALRRADAAKQIYPGSFGKRLAAIFRHEFKTPRLPVPESSVRAFALSM